MTGEFDPPEIDDFTPGIGAAGTRVLIEGRNFVGPGAGETAMAVLFGSVPAAAVRPLSATQIEATVPGGFDGGRITVLAPGGEARSLREFLVSSGLSGTLQLPTGFDPADMRVDSVVGRGTLDAQGNFEVPFLTGRATLVAATTTSRPFSVFFNLVLPAEKAAGTVVLDARSTAVGMILVQPVFATASLGVMTEFKARLAALPEVDELTRLIEQTWAQSADPMNDPTIEAALDTALTAAAAVLPSNSSARAIPRAPARTRQASGSFHFAETGNWSRSCLLTCRSGPPLRWLCRPPPDGPTG